VLYTGRGMANLALVNDAWVQAKYGVPASGYADFATLRGDPSDGLPGVPGVGDKTAAELIRRWGSLEALLEAIDDPAADLAVRVKLTAARTYLGVAGAVVRVVRDLPVPELSDTLPDTPADTERLVALSSQWGLDSSVARLVTALMRAAAAPGDAGSPSAGPRRSSS
jgi:5'-3' exonuclease